MKYLCESCGEERYIESDRGKLTWACDVCNAFQTHVAIDYDLTALSDAQRDFLRSIFDIVMIKNTSGNTRLHIPKPGGQKPYCDREGMERKEIAKYPIGYTDWCSHCLSKLSRSSVGSSNAGNATTRDTCIKGLMRAYKKLGHWPSEKEYIELNITPAVSTIREVIGFADARDCAKDMMDESIVRET